MTITMIDASMVAGMLMTSYCIMMSANQPGRVNLVVLTERHLSLSFAQKSVTLSDSVRTMRD